jgi:hypothetical protein
MREVLGKEHNYTSLASTKQNKDTEQYIFRKINEFNVQVAHLPDSFHFSCSYICLSLVYILFYHACNSLCPMCLFFASPIVICLPLYPSACQCLPKLMPLVTLFVSSPQCHSPYLPTLLSM